MGIGLITASAIGGVYSSYKGAKAQGKMVEAQKKAANYNAELMEDNARLLYEKADDVVSMGAKEEESFRKEVKGVIGSQRASFGASGAVVDEGSALDVVKDAQELGEQDAMTIRLNTRKQRDAYRDEAINTQKQAELTRMGVEGLSAPNPYLSAGTSLLTGATRMYGSYKKNELLSIKGGK